MTSAIARHGAPGVFLDVPARPPMLRGVPRDLAVFAGVAPRGPSRVRERTSAPDETVAEYLAGAAILRSVAVEVDSWTEYQRAYGGFEGEGRLPYAVSAFFAQGGRRARVVRIVHDYAGPADADGRSAGVLAAPAGAGWAPVTTTAGDEVIVRARDEGSWGDGLRATLRFATRPLLAEEVTPGRFAVAVAEWIPVGSLVRATSAAGERELHYVGDSEAVSYPDRAGQRRVVTLGTPLPAAPVALELVTAVLDVADDDPLLARTQTIDGVGLSPDHPRWLARVIDDESEQLWAEDAWVQSPLALADPALPDLHLAARVAGSPELVLDHLTGGRDRSADIVAEDFFDPLWVPGDEQPGAGVQCIAELTDVGMLLAPDLYDPAPLDPVEDVTDPPSPAGPDFAPCVDVAAATTQPPQVQPLSGLRLDPTVPADLARIEALQAELVSVGAQYGGITVLLDAPLGLTTAQLLQWRANFDSAGVAAYHPWLDVATPDDARDTLVRLTPSAFAAGVIAARELAAGVFYGPANVVVSQAVRVAVRVPDAEHDDLHDAGVNVYRQVRDGVRLTGARTLATDASLRQLSVARLLSVIALTLQREMAWAVFEPSGPALWATVRRAVSDYLDELRAAGALAGTTAADAYFVRCDESTMSPADLDAGRLIALVGVAPVEPIEYLVLRLTVDGESTATVEVGRG